MGIFTAALVVLVGFPMTSSLTEKQIRLAEEQNRVQIARSAAVQAQLAEEALALQAQEATAAHAGPPTQSSDCSAALLGQPHVPDGVPPSERQCVSQPVQLLGGP